MTVHTVEYTPDQKVTRYLLTGGRLIDCRSSHSGSSTERDFVLRQALDKWGGKLDDWKIEGSCSMPDQQTLEVGT